MQKKKSPRRRTPKAYDWISYVAPLADEMSAAVEILIRLRWAHALARRHLAVAPSTFPGGGGRYRSRSVDSDVQEILDRLLAPEDIVQQIQPEEIKKLLDDWESEVREWGMALWKHRGEVLRLRGERNELLDDIRWITSLGIAERGEARRMRTELEANPTRPVRAKSGWEWQKTFVP